MLLQRIKLIALLMLVPAMLMAKNHPLDKLIEKYSGKDGFSIVNINEDMLDMLPLDIGGNKSVDIHGMVQNIDGVKIISYDPSEVKTGKKIDFYDEVIKTVPLKQYKELMTIEEKDQKVKFLVKKEKEKIKEFIMLTKDGDEVTIIWISGDDIDLNMLSRLSPRHLKAAIHMPAPPMIDVEVPDVPEPALPAEEAEPLIEEDSLPREG